MLGRLRIPYRRRDSSPQTGVDAEAAYREHAVEYPGRLALLWIRIVSKNLVWTHVIATLIVFGTLNLALLLFPLGGGQWVDWLREVVVAVVAIFVPILGTVISLNRPLRPLLKIIRDSSTGAGVIYALFGDTFMRMAINLMQLRDGGALLEPWQVTEWVRRCFKSAKGQYVGTDSHLPGAYKKLYSDYLAAHEEYLRTTKQTDSVRIMLVDIEQLRTDRNENPEEFNTFMQWHARERASVALLRLSAHANQDIFDTTEDENSQWDPKLTSADIGFWRGNFALLFQRPGSTDASIPSTVRVWLTIAGEPLYAECERYVACLLDKTQYGKGTQADVTAALPIYSDELSNHWDLFCEPDKRIQQTGTFLDTVLARFERRPQEIPVFDAATGIGVEATHLLKQNYFLVANELEPALRQAAQDYAHTQDAHIPDALFTQLDWLTMSGELSESFKAVYVLGNSLCHLESMAQVNHVLQNFYDVLVPGGILLCDERNFDYIDRAWDAIYDDPWNEFRFNKRKDKVMYPGHRVLGAPVRRDSDRVVFEYAEVDREKESVKPKQIVGELSMMPFPKNALRQELTRVGFTDVEVYCDLIHQEDGELRDDADFFTYVAVKPG